MQEAEFRKWMVDQGHFLRPNWLHTMSVELGSRQAVIQQLRQLTLEFAEAEVG
jgi:hypothetical protein